MLGVVVDAYNKSVPINTEIEDKKTNLNLNNTNILLHWFITFPEGVYGGKGGKEGTLEIWGMGGYSGTSDLDLGKKVGNLDFFWGLRKKSWKFGFLGWGGFWNFGFGLRKKSWKFGFLGWGILELRIWT